MYIARSSEIASRNLDGEMIIMSAKDSTLFTLNDVATVIWEAADGVTPLEEIVERKICAEFDVDRNTAMEDARELVQELTEHGILSVSETRIAVQE
jgi:predicted transcriptional regulator YheO